MTTISITGSNNESNLILESASATISDANNASDSVQKTEAEVFDEILMTETDFLMDVNTGLKKNNPYNRIHMNSSFCGLETSLCLKAHVEATKHMNEDKILALRGCGLDKDGKAIYEPAMQVTDAFSNFDELGVKTHAQANYGSHFWRRYVAKSVNAFDGDIIAVPATMRGMYLVLEALPWQNNDVMISFDWHYLVDYGSFGDFIKKFAQLGITITNKNIPCLPPVNLTYDQALAYYINKLDILIAEQEAAGKKVRIIIWDHISWQGMGMPTAGLCDYCTSKGILNMVDGAHTFGIMKLDLSRDGPLKNCDFYCANTHKYFHGLQGCGWVYYKGGASNRLNLKHTTPYWMSGVNLPFGAWASWQNSVDGGKLTANSILLNKMLSYGLDKIENNMRIKQKYMAEALAKKLGQKSIICSVIFNSDGTVNQTETNKICGPQVFVCPVETDKYPELYVVDSSGGYNSAKSRYEYNNTLLPNKSHDMLSRGLTNVRSSFVGKVYTAVYKRGIVHRNTNTLLWDLSLNDGSGAKIKISTLRFSIGNHNTMQDCIETVTAITEEYDKLIAGYVKCKDDIPSWEANDKYLTDPDVKYLFEMNGNLSRDRPAELGSGGKVRAPGSGSGQSEASYAKFASFSNATRTGKVYDASFNLVDGELVAISEDGGENIMTWRAL